MGEFSYTQPDDFSGYGDFSQGYGQPGTPAGEGAGHGQEDYATGYEQPNESFGYEYQEGGYQQELAALIPQGVPLLGAILLEQGVLSPEVMQQAIAKQHETGLSLAQILLDHGWAAPDQLVQALQVRASYGAAA